MLMELKINKKKFTEILAKVQGITLSKTSMPILSNVFIKADHKNKLSIMATDLEIGFSGLYSTEVIKPGKITIPSKKIFEIVKDFPKEIIHIKELENKWIQIVDESVEYNMVGMDPEEFPSLPDIENVHFLEIEATLLKKMIDKTIYSVLTGEGYVEMTGMYIEQEKKEGKNFLNMVSTDGHRLSFVKGIVDKPKSLIIEKGVIIPRKGILEATKLLDAEGIVRIGVKENKFILKKDNEIVITRIIEGEYPTYQNIIPWNNKKSLIVNKETLLMMLRRMSIFSSEKYRGVKFKIDKDRIEIINTNPELGESSERAGVQYTGEVMEIGFNPKYFIDTLNNMESEKVTIKFKDHKSSCLISGDSDENFLSVIMPMRV
jgi:DNA polymerase-3 subunit beta